MTQLSQSNVTQTGHSSDVDMNLHVAGQTFPVQQSSFNRIKVKDVSAIPRGEATLDISIDGRLMHHSIRLLGDSDRPNWIVIEQR